jgi:hypothetical protein
MTVYYIWNYLLHELRPSSVVHNKSTTFCDRISPRLQTKNKVLIPTEMNPTGKSILNPEVTFNMKAGQNMSPTCINFTLVRDVK